MLESYTNPNELNIKQLHQPESGTESLFAKHDPRKVLIEEDFENFESECTDCRKVGSAEALYVLFDNLHHLGREPQILPEDWVNLERLQKNRYLQGGSSALLANLEVIRRRLGQPYLTDEEIEVLETDFRRADTTLSTTKNPQAYLKLAASLKELGRPILLNPGFDAYVSAVIEEDKKLHNWSGVSEDLTFYRICRPDATLTENDWEELQKALSARLYDGNYLDASCIAANMVRLLEAQRPSEEKVQEEGLPEERRF